MEELKRHNGEVVVAIKPDRLLVFDPGNGWEPLCRFLELPVPGDGFTELNKARRFRKNRLGLTS